jgi:peptide/nickel transport system substrate-binding protein
MKRIRLTRISLALSLSLVALLSACSREEELTLDEINRIVAAGKSEILEKTVSKPWRGEAFVDGKVGGTWYSSMTEDPKSFNLQVAERDATTAGVVARFHDYLVDYDYVRHEYRPQCASFEIVTDERHDRLSVIYTLRDDLWWSFYGSDRKVKVTSDDVVFWYNEIEGDPGFQSSSYNGHFVTMPDGSQKEITIEKLDDRRFAFHFPRIVANPLLATNREFGPRFIYEPAKKAGGVDGVLALFSVASDPKEIPSMGTDFLVEYTPAQRLVFRRNPDYWKKDGKGAAVPYPEESIVQIVPDENTQLLLFKEGKQDSYGLRPTDLDELINRKNADYTVFAADGSLGASLWSFNENPKNAATPQYAWFTKKEFRQAMSCLLNRDRIATQTYRGLAEPKLDFFPEANPFYNPAIRLQYTYDPARAVSLLSSIGIKRGADGVMRDGKGNAIEFDLSVMSDNAILGDISSIIVDECKKVGITVNVRATDFQKLVEDLTSTYGWQSIIIGLGANYWPTQGSNVWPTTGNLHLWYPLQKKPATDWEARVDWLYNEGSYTIDRDKAARYWDEYQRILLEQCPLIYLVRPRSFIALRNRWDFSNVYFDNIGGFETSHISLRQ